MVAEKDGHRRGSEASFTEDQTGRQGIAPAMQIYRGFLWVIIQKFLKSPFVM